MIDPEKPLKAVLLLADGNFFEGLSVGKIGTTVGEICFNTGMTGYQEIYTDPSYYGQILVNTCAHIGNYGIKSDESESQKVRISGLVVKNYNVFYSRNSANTSLQKFLEEYNTVGISNIDTRQLVRIIREKGAMNAIISSEISDIGQLREILNQAPNMQGLELASKVSTAQAYDYGDASGNLKVAAIDFGIKVNILRCFAERGISVRVFPHHVSWREIQDYGPKGYFLSNGPGDPAALPQAVALARNMIETGKPVFGICLGHQILALALNIPTYKMHYGHRGLNHPVVNLLTGKCEITSQNHGFGIVNEATYAKKDLVQVTHVNLNDETIEGIKMINKPVFSVQYHPEASPGPHDARYLFDEFYELLLKV